MKRINLLISIISLLTLTSCSNDTFPSNTRTSKPTTTSVPTTSETSTSVSTDVTSNPTSEVTTSITTSEVSTSTPTSETTSQSTSEKTSASTSNPTSVTSEPTSKPTSAPTSAPTSTSKPTNVPSTSIPTSSDISSSTSEEDDSKVESIRLSDHELTIFVGKRSDSITVNYTPEDLELEYKEVIWESLDENIATVDQYGRVTGVKKGKTVVVCTTIEGARKDRCIIYVVDSDSVITKKWYRVSDPNELNPGDIVVIGSPEGGVTATAEHTGMYLHSAVSTFSSSGDEITSLNPASDTYMLNHDEEGWTLEGEEGKYLATTHTGKVTYIYKTGNIHWDILKVDGFKCIEISSTSTIEGWFMYNQKADKFTTYTSNAQIDMFVISLYRQTIIYE